MNHHSAAARICDAISDHQDSETDTTNNSIDECSNEYISPHTQLIKTMISIIVPEDDDTDKDKLNYVDFR